MIHCAGLGGSSGQYREDCASTENVALKIVPRSLRGRLNLQESSRVAVQDKSRSRSYEFRRFKRRMVHCADCGQLRWALPRCITAR